MGLAKDIRTVTEMKSRAAQLLDDVNQQKRPVVITQDGKPRAVVMDVDSYEDLRNALGVLKLAAQGEKDLRDGHWVAQDTLFATLKARLQQRRKHGATKT